MNIDGVKQWLRGGLSEEDAFWLSKLGLSSLSCSSEKIKMIQEEITVVMTELTEKFKAYAIPEIGFQTFEDDDLLHYLFNPHQFNFSFNRVQGKGILYGMDHVFLRRLLFNNLSNFLRLALFKVKADVHDIFNALSNQPSCPSLFKRDNWQDLITNVRDIGMGHTIYVISTENERWVIKKEKNLYQSFYNDMLTQIGYRSFQSYSVETEYGAWEISEFIGFKNLQETMKSGSLSRSLEMQLAEHCCLGDVLGRGDRHFENYIVKNDVLYPLDVSFLFWDDNETWVQRYLKAGMSEMSALYVDISTPSVFEFHLNVFFETYQRMFFMLRDNKEMLLDTIRNWSFSESEKQHHLAFVEARLNDKEYCKRQFKAFFQSFSSLCKRQYMKQLLKQLFHHCPEEVLKRPLLKMYYYSDKYRLSSFFLLDFCERKYLFDDITQLSEQFLSVSSQDISNQLAQLHQRIECFQSIYSKWS